MEKRGSVSLWVGMTKSARDLSAFVEGSYSEDGDYVLSSFERAFNMHHYDEDSIEMEYYEHELTDVREISADFSYYESIAQGFSSLPTSTHIVSFNSVVLIYNFTYDESQRHFTDGVNQFEYIGAVEY